MKKFILLLSLVLSYTTFFSQEPVNNDDGVAIEGYDVVSYFEGKAEKGNPEFTSEVDGVTYWFVSEDHRFKFNKTPLKYFPEYGGFCAYAIAKDGKKVSVNPKTFLVKDDKLYLFYNSWGANTLKKWNKEDHTLLQKEADKNWLKITQ